MAECSPGILEDLGLPLSTAEREFTVAVFHALKPALSTGFLAWLLFLKSGLLFLSSLTVDKRLGGGGHTIIPSTREAEAGESLEV